MTEYAWVPTPEAIEHANVTRFMRAHGAADIDELRAKSVADIDWFWDARGRGPRAAVHAAVLGRARLEPRDRVDDVVHGRRLQRGHGLRRALARARAGASIHEDETGEVTHALLRRAVVGGRPGRGRAARAGRRPRRRRRAVHADGARGRASRCTRPRRSARSRCRCSRASPRARSPRGCRTRRPRSCSPPTGPGGAASTRCCEPVLDEAVAAVAVRRARRRRWRGSASGEDSYAALSRRLRARGHRRRGPAADRLHVRHDRAARRARCCTQAGFVVKVAMEVAYEFDLHRGDVFTWITDMGWIMGPLSVDGRARATAARCCSTRARRTRPTPIACGSSSSATASPCSASRRR